MKFVYTSITPNIRFAILTLLAGILSTGCHQTKKHTNKSTDYLVVSDPSANASCPYLTKDHEGHAVLSWLQQDNAHGEAMMYYAIFSDSNMTFGKPKNIAVTKGAEPHGENMPKMIFQKNGHLLAVYSVKNPHPGNPYTGAVYYTQSFDKGKNWTKVQPLVKDTAKSYDQRYFDVTVLPSGKTGIVWLNNSKPKGSTLCFAKFEDNKAFSKKRIIGNHTCQCCRTNLLVDDSGRINVAWRGIYHDSIRDMFYCYSIDSGKTFSEPERISPDNWVVDGCPHTGPSMAENKNGLHFTWFTMGGGGGVYYCHTDNKGRSFSPREAVSRLPSARHPQIAAMPDDDLVIVWDEGVQYGNQLHQRIGLQLRGPTGLLLSERYLTPDSTNATFPVIQVLNNRTVLVAYTLDKGKRQQVSYKIVNL